MEISILYIKILINEKLKEKKDMVKISSFLLIILLIYIFENHNNIYKIFQKKNAIQYINNIYGNHLINNNHIEYINENPNISVIIPLFNCQNSISMSIYSVQIQDFKNFEIILIDDFSSDKTLQIVNEISLYDRRIRIINNKKNMGILYSRSIGVLAAKGKYILCLDNDDLFYDEYLFKNILKIEKMYNFDIVEFKSFYVKKYENLLKLSEITESHFNDHPNNYTLSQPNLGIFPISKNGKYYSNDFHLWGKLIKINIYKKAIFMLTEKYYSFYNCWTEDISMLFIIFNIAQSFIFIDLYGIIHLDYKKSITYTLHYSNKLMSELFFLDIIIKYIKNIEKNKIYIMKKLESILKSKYMAFLNNEHLKYLKLIINKIHEIGSLTEKEHKIINNYEYKFNIK